MWRAIVVFGVIAVFSITGPVARAETLVLDNFFNLQTTGLAGTFTARVEVYDVLSGPQNGTCNCIQVEPFISAQMPTAPFSTPIIAPFALTPTFNFAPNSLTASEIDTLGTYAVPASAIGLIGNVQDLQDFGLLAFNLRWRLTFDDGLFVIPTGAIVLSDPLSPVPLPATLPTFGVALITIWRITSMARRRRTPLSMVV
jgi:hypothetical protein